MSKLALFYSLIFSIVVVNIFAQSTTEKPSNDTEKAKSEAQYQKELEQYEINKKKIEANNTKIQLLINEGTEAYANQDYNLALAKFSEAETIDDYWGMITVILNNKAIILRLIAVEIHNNSKSNSKTKILVVNHLQEAIRSLHKSITILNENEPTIDKNARNSLISYRYTAIQNLAETYRVLTLIDISYISEAITAYNNYILIEKDESLRKNAEKILSDFKALNSIIN